MSSAATPAANGTTFVKPDTSAWKLSDLEMKETLGTGSFGRVRLCKHKNGTDYYAIKCLKKREIIKMKQVQHIIAEKNILAEISHPFTVNMLCAFQDDKKLYLVLEFVIGGEMFTHLRSAGRFPNDVAKFYHAELVLAFEYLHSKDIIYRDLKPENAVLDKDGHVCLTDFGLAKTNVRGATSAKTFCGTPEYLAPEFLIGVGHGKAVDWWSLGVLLYEMLCGIPPFYSENVTEMYELILKKPLEFPPDVSPAAQDLLRKLLDRNPQARLQDVDRFKAHPFFADVNFPDLYARKIRPPFVPDPAVLNFDDEFTKMKVDRLGQGATGQTHTKIAGFTYDGR